MERKAKLELCAVIFILVIIAIPPLKVLFTETNTNLQLLAIGIILTIVLGGGNMLKSLFKSAEADALEKANRLKAQEIELLKKQMKVGRVIGMLRNFIKPLISAFEEKIRRIDNSLSGQQFALSNFLIRIDYEYAHTDILGDENYELVKEKVDEYNNLVRAERLKEAKEIGVDLKNRLEELEGEYMVNFDIPKEERKKDHSPITVLRQGEVGVGHRQEPR